jgi:hypothetical protein
MRNEVFMGGPMAFFDANGAIERPEDFERPDWMQASYGRFNPQRSGQWGVGGNQFMNWNNEYLVPPEQAAEQAMTPQGVQQPAAPMQQGMTQPAMQPNMAQNALMPGQPTIGGQPMNMMNQYESRFRPMSPMQGYQNALMGA